MAQNKNGSINQFLHSKATNNNNSYYHSLRTFYNNEPYFDKTILSQTAKRVTPSLELKADLTNEKNKLKLSLKESVNNYQRNLNNNRIKNNHIFHNSSNNFLNSTSSKTEQRYNSLIRTEISPDREYKKIEDNIIRRSRSGYYSNLQEDQNVKDDDKKIERNNNHRKRIWNIIQTSPSQPLFYNSKYNLTENTKVLNSNGKKIDEKVNLEKAYTSHNNNPYSLNYNRSLDIKSMSRSINDINHEELDNKNRSIQNFKSNTVKRNNTLDGKINHIFVNDLDENSSNIKENYKYHSITVKKAKINKEDLRIDLKRKYNIYSNRFDSLNLNENFLNYSNKTISPKKISIFHKNYFSNRNKFDVQKSGEITKKYILKKNENHTIFESINLSKRKQKGSEEKNNLYNSSNLTKNGENKSLRGITGKSLDEIRHINSVESEKRIRDKFTSSSYKIESKDANKNKIKFGTQYINKNRNRRTIVEKKELIGNGINYIYEGRNMKQKSLIEVTNDLNNLLENEMSKSSDLSHSNIIRKKDPINKNDSLNINKYRIKSLGNIKPKITKRSIERLKIKEITMKSEGNKTQKSDSYYKTEERKKDYTFKKDNDSNNSNSKNNYNHSKDLIIKKSNSISIVSKKQAAKNKIKKISLKKIRANNINNEICKVSDIIFYGKQTKKDNNKSNIIIIINNTDKNNSKKTAKINNKQKNENTSHNNDNIDENNINLNSNPIKESLNNNNISSKNNINNDDSKKNNIVNINLKKINNIKINKINIIKKNSTEQNKNLKIKNDIIKNIKKQNNSNNNLVKKINKNIIKNNLNDNIKEDNKKDAHEKEDEIKEVKTEIEVNNKKNEKEKEKEANESKKEENIINNNQSEKKDNNNKAINIKEEINDIKDNSITENNKNINKINISKNSINMNPKTNDNIEKGKSRIDEKNNIKKNEAHINLNLNEEINSPRIKPNYINDSQNINQPQEESKKIDLSLKSIIPSLIGNNMNNIKNLNIDISKNKIDIKSEANLINRYNNFLTKKELDEQSSNSSQEKKPDFNNNDCSIEEIHEIKPVIQHNIQRKRPVFTLPSSKKRSVSQGKPFSLIQKYYDENFILEDDAEEKFNQYIKIDGDSRNDSLNNSQNSSFSSNSSITVSNKKSNHIKSNEKNNNDSNIDIEQNEIKISDNSSSKDNSDIKNPNSINNNYSGKNNNIKFNNKKIETNNISYENKENENFNITSIIRNNN